MILSAESIRREIKITPFCERAIFSETGTSYGLSLCGYDVRAQYRTFLASGDFTLNSIIEHIEMPLDVVAIVHDKSSLARIGLALQNTVIEPGWKGYLTIELSNHGSSMIMLPAGAPIAQILFHRLDAVTPGYTGKYQNQPSHPVGALRD